MPVGKPEMFLFGTEMWFDLNGTWYGSTAEYALLKANIQIGFIKNLDKMIANRPGFMTVWQNKEEEIGSSEPISNSSNWTVWKPVVQLLGEDSAGSLITAANFFLV